MEHEINRLCSSYSTTNVCQAIKSFTAHKTVFYLNTIQALLFATVPLITDFMVSTRATLLMVVSNTVKRGHIQTKF
jgi:hypothetical protein